MKTGCCVAAVTLTLAATAAPAAESVYPVKPVRIVLGVAPGGNADIAARIVAEVLSRDLSQPMLVENRPGAGSTIAADLVARAPADGYTLLVGNASLMGVDKFLYDSVKYTPADFRPITRFVASPLVLSVSTGSGITSVAELIARAKARPGGLNFSSSGNGIFNHLTGLNFARLAGIEWIHVPYKGGAPSVQAVVSGEVQATFATPPAAKPLMDAGKLTGLAVTSLSRFSLLPNYPTVAEAANLPGFEMTIWNGLFAPAKTPNDIVARLFSASVKALGEPAVKSRLTAVGSEAAPSSSPEEFRAFAMRDGRLVLDLAIQGGAKAD